MNFIFRSLLVAAVIFGVGSAHPLSPARPGLIVLDFSPRSTSLSEAQRQQVINAIDKVREDNWCWFGSAIVEGFSSDDEGDRHQQDQLALARARLVAEILERYRIPRTHVRMSLGRDSDGRWLYDGHLRQYVVLTFNATSSLGAICPPLDAGSGLRLSPIDVDFI